MAECWRCGATIDVTTTVVDDVRCMPECKPATPPEPAAPATARMSSWTCGVCRAYVPAGVQHPECAGARKDAPEPDEAFAQRLADAAASVSPRSPEAMAAFAAGPEVSGAPEPDEAERAAMLRAEAIAQHWLASEPADGESDVQSLAAAIARYAALERGAAERRGWERGVEDARQAATRTRTRRDGLYMTIDEKLHELATRGPR